MNKKAFGENEAKRVWDDVLEPLCDFCKERKAISIIKYPTRGKIKTTYIETSISFEGHLGYKIEQWKGKKYCCQDHECQTKVHEWAKKRREKIRNRLAHNS